jgi:hypothetical protein
VEKRKQFQFAGKKAPLLAKDARNGAPGCVQILATVGGGHPRIRAVMCFRLLYFDEEY